MEALFIEVAEATSLREGAEGVENLFWVLSLKDGWTSRDLASELRLPIPVVAAIRRELERRGYLERGAGIRLSETGLELAKRIWGIDKFGKVVCSTCNGTGLEFLTFSDSVKSEIRQMIGRRPKPEPALDQVHLTEESLLRKAHLLICKGYVLGKNVVFIGDDDFLSLAVLRIVSARHGESALSKCRVSVFDIDDRIVTEIGNLAKDLALPVQAYQADARESLKEDLRGSFDVAITDPPYTVKGTEIFLERCLDALSSDGGRIILSKGGKAGSDQLALQRFWSSRNLVLTEFYPGYNKYQGGSILAGQSDLYFLIRVPENRGQREDLPGPFYTIEAGTGARPYFCTACGHKVLVGPNAGIGTIQNLKELGCPVCSGTKFRYAPKQGKKE